MIKGTTTIYKYMIKGIYNTILMYIYSSWDQYNKNLISACVVPSYNNQLFFPCFFHRLSLMSRRQIAHLLACLTGPTNIRLDDGVVPSMSGRSVGMVIENIWSVDLARKNRISHWFEFDQSHGKLGRNIRNDANNWGSVNNIFLRNILIGIGFPIQKLLKNQVFIIKIINLSKNWNQSFSKTPKMPNR